MMKKIILFVFLLAGCATSAQYEKFLDSWVGSDERRLVEVWGSPSIVYEHPPLRYLTYNKTSTVHEPGTLLTFHPEWLGNSLFMGQTLDSSGNSSTRNCNTTFILEGQIIKSWRYEGNACRANESF
jgi:hypothetical protein